MEQDEQEQRRQGQDGDDEKQKKVDEFVTDVGNSSRSLVPGLDILNQKTVECEDNEFSIFDAVTKQTVLQKIYLITYQVKFQVFIVLIIKIIK